MGALAASNVGVAASKHPFYGGSVMCGSLHVRFAAFLAQAVALSCLMCMSSHAGIIWSDDFESYTTNANIDGKSTTWRAATVGGDWGYVRSQPTYPVHGGDHSLSVQSYHYDYNGYWKGVHWDDTAPGLPHGGEIELSLWMYVDTSTYSSPHWRISMQGWNDNTVAEIGNYEVGSISTIDYHTTAGWTESFQTVNPGSSSGWHNVKLDVDFSQNPNQYKFVVDNNSWSEWYSLGTNEQYLGHINLLGISASVSNASSNFYDDISVATVPEPSFVFLCSALSLAAICVYCYRRKRSCVL
jgi:hypothetical protein